MVSNGIECSKCGERFPIIKALTVCPKCEGALVFKYDLAAIAEMLSKDDLTQRNETFWKFIELLPLSSPESIVTLGEPYTPILRFQGSLIEGFKNVYIKDDGRLPTGTFKARGMAVAVSCLKELGVRRVAIPSAGNAAAALAAYGAKADLEIYTFMPKDVPDTILKECIFMKAKTYLVDGLINDAAEIVKRFQGEFGWFNLSTNKQPYRFEGYKAMAFEIAEQFNWRPPSYILFPTGGGEGIIGLWKGFQELKELGWTEKNPHLIAVQSSGCAPIVKAYEDGRDGVEEEWKGARTMATGLRVPRPYASYLVLQALRETEGMAIAVNDEDIALSMKNFFEKGLYACPEAAATLAGLHKLAEAKILDSNEEILLHLTGNAMVYSDAMTIERAAIPILDRDTVMID